MAFVARYPRYLSIAAGRPKKCIEDALEVSESGAVKQKISNRVVILGEMGCMTDV